MPSAAVFDCDGVLFDSNPLKTEAFRRTLAAFPGGCVEAFLDYHRREGGVSRYVKFRRFLTDFVDPPSDPALLDGLLERFSAICRELYRTAPLTPCCVEVLEALGAHACLFVASGSDEAELREILQERKLAHHFTGIYGSPKTKRQCAEEIALAFRDNGSMLMIGDAHGDWQAAQSIGAHFVFMGGYSDAAGLGTDLARKGMPVIETLCELPALIGPPMTREQESA